MLCPVSAPLSTDVNDPNARVYFIQDQQLTYAQLRAKLLVTDLDERSLWIGRVMREARYRDVWKLVRLVDVLPLWPRIERHLGRMHAFWQWLLEGWKADGLLPRTD
jgi:hypothetical protein